jgi:4-hydroxybenzoate polyprenyltransferase
VRAYLELVRIPNVFTAMADIFVGFALTYADFSRWDVLAALLVSSACLYMAGIVVNDVIDYPLDLVQRPWRPLPSRRIALTTAVWLGTLLILGGIAVAWWASYLAGTRWPGLVAIGLAAAILAYDVVLKHSPLGPAAMGTCRGLNILLGASAGAAWVEPHYWVAAAMATYIAGVTWFSRSEAELSRRRPLFWATGVIIAGLTLVAMLPQKLPDGVNLLSPFDSSAGARFTVLVAFLGALIVRRCLVAIALPVPIRVQQAVKLAILSLVLLDAAVCFLVRGPIWGMSVAALLLPSLALGRWVYST